MDEIIRRCVDFVSDGYEGICDSATQNSNNCLECFKKQFWGNNEISYDCDYKINIYVGRYFPVHVKENLLAYKLLEKNFISSLLELEQINVMNIGGGPGSDSYATKKFFKDFEIFDEIDEKKINILRIDREENWNDIAGFINKSVTDSEILSFQQKRFNFDIGDRKSWKIVKRKFNIFTLSYFISEFDDHKIGLLAEYINKCASFSCSAVLVNDINLPKVNNSIHMLLSKLDCLSNQIKEDNSISWCGFHFNDNDREFIRPKLKTSSVRYAKVCHQ